MMDGYYTKDMCGELKAMKRKTGSLRFRRHVGTSRSWACSSLEAFGGREAVVGEGS
jgi:hypothetical protein